MKQKLDIIKIGGNLIDDEKALKVAISAFSENKNLKILVHGGGKMATKLSTKLGIITQMQKGRRVTTAEDLEVVTMVYAGLINKKIVVKLQALNCNAIGLSGADLNSIQANKRQNTEIDFGFVGDIVNINIENVNTLLLNNFCPVFSAITHDGSGQLLNTNADSVAARLASAFAEIYQVRLLYCFEKNGVLIYPLDEYSVIPALQEQYYIDLKNKGIIQDGMLPKLDNCFEALKNGVNEVLIGSPEIINSKTLIYSKLLL